MKSPFSPPTLPDVKPPRGRARLVIVLATVILPILAALIWYSSYRLSGSSSVEKLKARIRERGEPASLAELAAKYPPIPDQSNGAVALLQEWKKESPAFWEAFENGAKHMPPRADRRVNADVPFLGTHLERVSRSMVLESSNLIAAKEYLRENQDHLEAIRTALRYPRFRFPVAITNGFETLLPHLSEIKREAMNFRVAGLVAAERGDLDGAIQAVDETARSGDTLTDEPFLIGQLVRLACFNLAVEDLERLLSQRSLSAAQLEKAEAILNRLQAAGAVHKSLATERAMGISAFNLPLQSLARLGSSDPDSDEAARMAGQVGTGIWNLTGLREADQRLLLETFDEAIPLADRDDPAALQQVETIFQDAGEKARKFPPKILTGMLLPGLQKVPQRFASFEARRRAALTAIAVERFRLAHEGHLPATLDDLKPQFLADVAQDPFDGQPLRFKALATGYVVYSVGPNRLDDGGKERTRKYSQQDYDETFTVER